MGETQPQQQPDKIVIQADESLYKVDVNGRAHKPAGSGSQSGDSLKNAHREAIDAHADQIREGADVQSAARAAYTEAIDAGLDEAAANEAAQAIYDAHESAGKVSDDTNELANAIERGDVSSQQSAEKIADLMAELQDVTDERDSLKAIVGSLQAQIAALSAQVTELQKRLDDKPLDINDPPELSDDEIDGLADSLLDRLNAGADGDDDGSEDHPPHTELELLDRGPKLAAIRQELANSPEGQKLSAALATYAELKAKSETRGWIGRKGRQKELVDAESVLLDAKIAFEKEVAKVANERGLYPGDEENAKVRLSDDMFTAIRGLDRETREAVNGVHERNKENRNIFTRGAVAVGRWLTGGGKVAQWAKAGGSGLVAGFGVGMIGVGIPITSAIGIGLGLGARGMATAANLDAIRAAENKDTQGNANTVLNDEEYRRLMNESAASGKSEYDQAKALAERIFESSRKRGYEQADRARRKANATMGKFGIGFAAGMFAGNYLHDAMNTANATNGVDGVDGDKVDHKVEDTFEFSKGADKIHSGEGWYSQFADMGMSHKEARLMFRDTALMDKLVDMGVAYVDNSTRIGGYGISMPSGGRLPEAVMQLIGEAMKTKGF